ncbi:MAG: AAA family ATPase, partial [Rhodoferax sp.]
MEIEKHQLRGRITTVSIEGFRSLQCIENLELPQLTVLIGSNGAGKSNFIRFFEMLSWMLKSQKLQSFVDTHGGGDDQFFLGARKTPRINAEIRIETQKGYNDYRFGLVHLSAGDSVMVVDEAYRFSDKTILGDAKWVLLDGSKEAQLVIAAQKFGSSATKTTAKTVVHLLRQCATYQFHDTSDNAPIRNRWDISESARLRSDGGNLAAVLLDLHDNDLPRYKQVTRQIQRVLPTFDDFVLEPVAGKVELRWRGKYSDKTFGAHLTSDGSLRLFCLLTLLSLTGDKLPDVLFFDEP